MLCAQRLTNLIQQIIEFGKMLPGFQRLEQEDQIALVKTGMILQQRVPSRFDFTSKTIVIQDFKTIFFSLDLRKKSFKKCKNKISCRETQEHHTFILILILNFKLNFYRSFIKLPGLTTKNKS